MRICGINSRFQLLFPSAGQVTHVLLTHPPLRYKRLACVRHAASVHPEPGSNSLKDFIHGHRLKLTKKLVQIPFPFITVFGLFHSRNCKEFSSIMCFAVQLSMCSVFLTALIFYHSVLLSVKHFFDYFFKAFYWLYRRNFYIISFKITAVN